MWCVCVYQHCKVWMKQESICMCQKPAKSYYLKPSFVDQWNSKRGQATQCNVTICTKSWFIRIGIFCQHANVCLTLYIAPVEGRALLFCTYGLQAYSSLVMLAEWGSVLIGWDCKPQRFFTTHTSAQLAIRSLLLCLLCQKSLLCKENKPLCCMDKQSLQYTGWLP